MNTEPNICGHCGKMITLQPDGDHYKWFTTWVGAKGAAKREWHCGIDPAFPVRGHAPARVSV